MRELLEKQISDGVLCEVDLCFGDQLCRYFGVDDDAVLALLSTLLAASREGHLCSAASELTQLLPNLDPVISNAASEAFSHLPSSLVTEAEVLEPLPSTALVRCKERLYLQKHWIYETLFLQHLERLSSKRPLVQCDATSYVQGLLDKNKLQPEQAQAIQQALEHTCLCISGGPGTGKTYTAGLLIQALNQYADRPLKFALAAPTGKAAAQLQASLHRVSPDLPPVRTLHSLLQLRPGQLLDPTEPPVHLDADVVLVDESSMIDVKLMAHLVSVVKNGARLILLGDKDQLPPVEAGCLFADLTRSEDSPIQVTQLKRCMRTELQELNDFAQAVKLGDDETAWQLLRGGSCVTHQDLDTRQSQIALQRKLVGQLTKRFQHSRDMGATEDAWFAAFGAFRVLSPMRQGTLGVDAMNDALRQACIVDAHQVLPIMVTSNDIQLELFNGECGLLVRHDARGRLTAGDYALFPDNAQGLRRVPALALPRFDYAYVLSVHKSQGSEYDHVHIMLPEGSERFGRQILYTAATRARKSLCVVGTEAMIRQTIRWNAVRRSGLLSRLSK